jgi:polyphosphate kinase
VFNVLTGHAPPLSAERLLVAPFDLRPRLLAAIHAQADAARHGRPARIVAKCNALTDPEVIEALCAASRAGARVDLVVRGICMLRPGVAGISERVTVRSILGRFLEHSRVYIFDRGTELRCYIGSADLMPRNLDHRVEILAPVEDPTLAAQVRDALDRCLVDNTSAWELTEDGSWKRRTPPSPAEKRSAQAEMMERSLRMAQFQGGRPLP